MRTSVLMDVLIKEQKSHDSLLQLVAYLEGEVARTEEHEKELSPGWLHFRKALDEFSTLLNSKGNSSAIIEKAFWLGTYYQSLMVDSEKLELRYKVLSLAVEKNKRDWPLTSKNMIASGAKEVAQDTARELWSYDHDKSIRLGEMCSEVWGILYNTIKTNPDFTEEDKKLWLNALPDKDSGIKPWLREIAPGYAQKRGRPRNK